MLRIQRKDKDGHERFVGQRHNNIGLAVYQMVALAQAEADNIPNGPFVDQSGPNEVSIYIGVYPIVMFKVVDENEEI